MSKRGSQSVRSARPFWSSFGDSRPSPLLIQAPPVPPPSSFNWPTRARERSRSPINETVRNRSPPPTKYPRPSPPKYPRRPSPPKRFGRGSQSVRDRSIRGDRSVRRRSPASPIDEDLHRRSPARWDSPSPPPPPPARRRPPPPPPPPSSRNRSNLAAAAAPRFDPIKEENEIEGDRHTIQAAQQRRIEELERELGESKEQLRCCKSSSVVVEQRLSKALFEKFQIEHSRSLLESQLRTTIANYQAEQNTPRFGVGGAAFHTLDALKNYERLRMESANQSHIIHQLKLANVDLTKKFEDQKTAWYDSRTRLKRFLDAFAQLKGEWGSLRGEIVDRLNTRGQEFDRLKDKIQATLDRALKGDEEDGRLISQKRLREQGKIIVEEVQLRELLAAVMHHTRAVAQTLIDTAQLELTMGMGEEAEGSGQQGHRKRPGVK